jgi:hypothetical protein
MSANDTPTPWTGQRRHNHPMHECALVALYVAIDAMKAYLADRGAVPDCTCPDPERCRGHECPSWSPGNVAYDMQGQLYTLEQFATSLDCEIIGTVPFLLRRHLRECADDLDLVEGIKMLLARVEAERKAEADAMPEPDAVCCA